MKKNVVWVWDGVGYRAVLFRENGSDFDKPFFFHSFWLSCPLSNPLFSCINEDMPVFQNKGKRLRKSHGIKQSFTFGTPTKDDE